MYVIRSTDDYNHLVYWANETGVWTWWIEKATFYTHKNHFTPLAWEDKDVEWIYIPALMGG